MKNQVKICLKIAWLAAAVTILFMGTTVCAAAGEGCIQAGNAMLALMLLITFPTGVFFFLIASIFVDPGSIHQPSDFVTAWFVMMCGGLLQWFLLVPGLFETPGLTTLNLQTAPAIELQNTASEHSSEMIQPASVSKPTVLATPASAVQSVSNRPRTRRKSIKPTAPFDRKGRTPLERVIDNL